MKEIDLIKRKRKKAINKQPQIIYIATWMEEAMYYRKTQQASGFNRFYTDVCQHTLHYILLEHTELLSLNAVF